jgi:hypothetical protein
MLSALKLQIPDVGAMLARRFSKGGHDDERGKQRTVQQLTKDPPLQPDRQLKRAVPLGLGPNPSLNASEHD